MDCLDKVKKDIIWGCSDDYEGLWGIINGIYRECPEMGQDEVRRATIRIIRDLLEEGLVVAGLLADKGGFDRWDMPVEDILRRIETEWDNATDEKDILTCVWFAITEKGAKEAEKIEQEWGSEDN